MSKHDDLNRNCRYGFRQNIGTSAVRGSVAVAVAVAVAFGSVPAVALADTGVGSAGDSNAKKTQVVYAKTDAAGAQEGVYVVNQFEVKNTNGATLRDDGVYQSVKNLTDDQELSAAGTSNFNVESGTPFLYQGDLVSSTQLPWTVSVDYKLDDKSVSAEELAGATGKLEMTLDITPNSTCAGEYTDNYLLQVSGSLDNNLASSIQADDATMAQSSGNTQLSYMVFPGKSACYTVTADVKDFTFDGWTVVGVPLSVALDIDNSQFSDATSDMDELEQAIKDIDSGSDSLKSGTSSMAEGAGSLSEGTGQLSSGAGQLSSSLDTFAVSGNQLVSGSDAYVKGLTSQAAALTTKAKAVDVNSAQIAYQQATQAYVAAFAGAFARVYAQTGSQEQAQAAAMQETTGEQAALQDAVGALVAAQATKSGNEAAASALSGAIDGYGELGAGIVSYTDAAQQLAQAGTTLSQAAGQVDSGATTLASGASQLDVGAGKLVNGTGQVAKQTNGLSQQMIDQVRDKLTDYLNPSFELTDFVNGSNEIDSVQFVIKTDAIEVPNQSDEEEAPEPEKTFFEKFLALFGL